MVSQCKLVPGNGDQRRPVGLAKDFQSLYVTLRTHRRTDRQTDGQSLRASGRRAPDGHVTRRNVIASTPSLTSYRDRLFPVVSELSSRTKSRPVRGLESLKLGALV